MVDHDEVGDGGGGLSELHMHGGPVAPRVDHVTDHEHEAVEPLENESREQAGYCRADYNDDSDE